MQVVIMAGGTGGHIIPALAVAAELKNQGATVQWLGTKEGLESELVPKNNIPLNFIKITGIRGKKTITKLQAPFKLIQALLQSIKLLRKVKPNLVIGMGGFVSGPGGLASWILGIPLIIHEQNAVAGTTNKILAKLSKQTLAAFPDSFPGKVNYKLVGNPIRQELLSIAKKRKDKELHKTFNLLVIGGSRGARSLNEFLPKLAKLNSTLKLSIWHQVGRGNLAEVQAEYAGIEDIKVEEFIEDIAEAYLWADLIICRSGALTVAELAAVGLPSILVPFPHAIDDHQFYNAKFLADSGGALIIRQHELEPEKVINHIENLAANRHKLNQMSEHAASKASFTAVNSIIASCNEFAKIY